MLTIDLDDFMFELKDGTLKHVGASDNSATTKLYDVTDVEVREFGDERVKVVCADDSGNTVEIALFPAEARDVARGIEALEDDSRVFGE